MKKWIWVICLTIILGAGVTGYVLAKNAPSIFDEEAENASTGGDSVGLECEFVLIEQYDLCGHKQQTAGNSREIIGKKKEEVANLYPDYTVAVFSEDKVVLTKTLEVYCNQHYILKLNGNTLEILREKDGEYAAQRQLNASLYDLSQEKKNILSHGKVFSSLIEVNAYLEGQ